MRNKKGELTTEQIVILVIMIISFEILLFFLFCLDFIKYIYKGSTKDVCHNSVITRGSSIIPTEGVPLQCEREYVCLTEDKSCEKMTKPVKYQVKTKEEVYSVLAEQMANCWWMFGEGRINYVGKDMKPQLYCSICSQVVFDDSVNEIFPEEEFDKVEFYQYLAVKNMTNSDETYAEYLFGTNEIWKMHSGDFGKIYTNKTYYILMGITSDVNKVGWGVSAGGTVLIITAGLIMSPFTGGATGVAAIGLVTGGLIAGVGVAGGAAGYFLAPIVAGESGNDYIAPSLIEANSQAFNDLGCNQIATLS